jgi:hypothetical protein
MADSKTWICRLNISKVLHAIMIYLFRENSNSEMHKQTYTFVRHNCALPSMYMYHEKTLSACSACIR